MLIDTHSHIYAEEFDADRREVIARAKAAGVAMIMLPAIDAETYSRQEELALSQPDLFRQMMGLHPTSVDDNYKQALEETRHRLFSNPEKYIGIGEIGLDFYWDTTYKKQQILALETQVSWASELNIPIVLHLRNGKDGSADTDAYSTIFHLLKGSHNTSHKGIMHCFSGTMADAEQTIDMGFLLGIGGTLTYKKSALPDIVRNIPLEKIVLETDSPYLAPVPYRGRRNEPSYVAFVAQTIADIKELPLEQVANITTSNALKLFNL